MYLKNKFERLLKIIQVFEFFAYTLIRGVYMIIEEYKIDKTIIRVDDRDIIAKGKDQEIVDILLSLTIKKISEYS